MQEVDFPRCGAKTRLKSKCKGLPMINGRCRMHGGASTGAPLGNSNALKHGYYTKAEKRKRKENADFIRECRKTIAELKI